MTTRCGDLFRICSDDQSDLAEFGDELDHCPGEGSSASWDGGVG